MMKKSRIMMSFFVIALAAALIGGATMAWFTAKVEVTNEFTAGTVMITAEEDEYLTDDLGNVNPGDCLKKVIDIDNTGTKEIKLRMKLEGEWSYSEAWLSANWDALCFSEIEKPTTELGWATFFEGLIDPASFTIVGWDYNENDGWWYYDGTIASEASVQLEIDVCFDGDDMTNEFQEAEYTLKTYFQAIQASNNAPWPN